MAQTVKNLLATQETRVLSLSQEAPLEKGMGNPLQYSCLETPMDRGARQYSPWGGREVDTTEQLARLFVCLCLVAIVAGALPLWWTHSLVLALGLSSCGADSRGSGLSSCGCSPAGGIISSPTRNQTHVPCTAQWIVNQWTTRGPCETYLEPSFKNLDIFNYKTSNHFLSSKKFF